MYSAQQQHGLKFLKFLHEKYNINLNQVHGESTALNNASLHGCLENVKHLLSLPGIANIINLDNSQCVKDSVREEHVEICKILIQKGAKINVQIWPKNGSVDSPLSLFCKNGDLEFVQFLFSKQRMPFSPHESISGLQAGLFHACKNNFIEIVKLLIQNKADVNKAHGRIFFPILGASQAGNLKIVKILIQNGAKCGFNSLFWSCNGHFEMLKLILKENPSVQKFINLQNGNLKRTPLMQACFVGDLSIVEFLLKHDANPYVEYGPNQNAFHLSIQGGNLDIVKLLLKKEKYNNICPLKFEAILKTCIKHGKIEIAKYLINQIDKGFKTFPNVLEKCFMSHCVDEKAIKFIELFLEYGKKVKSLPNVSFWQDDRKTDLVRIYAQHGFIVDKFKRMSNYIMFQKFEIDIKFIENCFSMLKDYIFMDQDSILPKIIIEFAYGLENFKQFLEINDFELGTIPPIKKELYPQSSLCTSKRQ